MKKLQNNFTTPEQSKRLLKLGVPAKSADCFWSNPIGSKMYASPIVRNKLSYRYKDWFKTNNYFYTPCWSVGRLMEIFDKCKTWRTDCYQDWIEYTTFDDYVEFIIGVFDFWNSTLDFSKLEG